MTRVKDYTLLAAATVCVALFVSLVVLTVRSYWLAWGWDITAWMLG